MQDKNAINTALKYQCRHDARRRFLQPNSCQKAPLKMADGSIKPECLACAGPVDITKTVKDPAMPNKETKATLDSLTALGLEPTPELKLNLPKAQMCACGRDYAEPYADGRRGTCKLCKKEHALAVRRGQTAKAAKTAPAAACKIDEILVTIPVSEQTKAVKLCKYCGQPAIIGKTGKSIGLCKACNAFKVERMNAARAANKAAAAAITCTNVPETPKTEQAPATPPPANFAEQVLPELLDNIHEYWQASLLAGEAVDPALAKILVTGELLFNFTTERQPQND